MDLIYLYLWYAAITVIGGKFMAKMFVVGE